MGETLVSTHEHYNYYESFFNTINGRAYKNNKRKVGQREEINK